MALSSMGSADVDGLTAAGGAQLRDLVGGNRQLRLARDGFEGRLRVVVGDAVVVGVVVDAVDAVVDVWVVVVVLFHFLPAGLVAVVVVEVNGGHFPGCCGGTLLPRGIMYSHSKKKDAKHTCRGRAGEVGDEREGEEKKRSR